MMRQRSGVRNRERLANAPPRAIFPVMMRRRRLVPILLVASGCYQYAAVSPGAATPADEVRLMLTAAGSVALVSTLGASTAAVEGKIVRVTDSAYVLAMSSTLKRDPEDPASMTRTVWAGESVSVPKSAVAGVERRSLNGRRTAMAAGAATILGVLAAKLIVHGFGSSSSDSGDGTPVVTP
jgi:hypothetical protein